MYTLNARQPVLKAGILPGTPQIRNHYLAANPVPRRSSVARTGRQERVLVIVPRASYSGNYYGPVGGDAAIKVIGVGGGGGNAVNRMINSGLQVNTSDLGAPQRWGLPLFSCFF